MIKSINLFLIAFILSSLFFNMDVKAFEVHEYPKKVVYLTFDDGPSRNTTKIMNILKKHKIKGTFFVVGNKINKREDILKQLIKEKHYIGLHTMSHNYNHLYRSKNASKNFMDEIIEEQELILKITGIESTLIRPPYSDGRLFSNQHIEDIINLNIKQWDWNVDTEDWKAKSVSEVLKNVEYSVKILRNKTTLVVLFHEHDLSVEALPVVIKYFKRQGYEFAVYNPNNHFPLNFKNNPDI